MYLTMENTEKQIHHGEQLKWLVDHSDLPSIAKLSLLMGISHTGIYTLYKKSHFEPKVIQRICQIFSVEPEEFKEKKFTGLNYSVKWEEPTDREKEIKLLEENSRLKDELLQAKDMIIELQRQINKRKN